MVLAAARSGLRRNASSSAAPFTPTSLTGLALWLDAGQITGSADGVAVGTWQDKSASARNFTQGTAARQPIFHSTGTVRPPTGTPVVQFDGVDDFITSTLGVTGSRYPGLTHFLVMAQVTAPTAANTGYLSSAPNGGVDYIDGMEIGNPTATSLTSLLDAGAYGVTDASYSFTRGLGVFFMTSTVMSGNGTTGSTSVYGDRVLLGTSSSTSNVGPSLDAVAMGGRVYGSGTGASYSPAAIAEMIVYNRALTAGERQQVESYLKTSHGTP